MLSAFPRRCLLLRVRFVKVNSERVRWVLCARGCLKIFICENRSLSYHHCGGAPFIRQLYRRMSGIFARRREPLYSQYSCRDTGNSIQPQVSPLRYASVEMTKLWWVRRENRSFDCAALRMTDRYLCLRLQNQAREEDRK